MKLNRMMRLIMVLSLCLIAESSKHRKKQVESKIQAPIIQKKINYDDNTVIQGDSSDIPDSDKLEMKPRKEPQQKEQSRQINNQFIQDKLPEMIGFLDQIIQNQSMDQDQFVFFNKIIQFGQKVQTFKNFPQDLQNQLISMNQKINQIQYIIQNQQLIQQSQQQQQQMIQQNQQFAQQSSQNIQQNQQDSQQDSQQQFQQLQQQYQQQQQQIQQLNSQQQQLEPGQESGQVQVQNQVNEQLNKFMDSIKDEMINQRDFLNGKVNGLAQKLTLIENSQKIFEQQQNSMLKQLLDMQQKSQTNQANSDEKQKPAGFQISSPLLLQQMQFQLQQNQMNPKPQNQQQQQQQQNIIPVKNYQQTQQQLDKYLFDTFRFKQKNRSKMQVLFGSSGPADQIKAESQLRMLNQQILVEKNGKQQQNIKAQIDKLQLQIEKQKRDHDFQSLLDNIDTKQMQSIQVGRVFDTIEKIIKIFLNQSEMQQFKTLQIQYEQFVADQVDNEMVRDNICKQIEFFNTVFDERIQRID